MDKKEKIRRLNDWCRVLPFVRCQLMISHGIHVRGDDFVAKALAAVMLYDNFHEGNDPHNEHDFGTFTVDGVDCYWKIDYLDKTGCYGSDDPSDPNKTTRHLTVALLEEY